MMSPSRRKRKLEIPIFLVPAAGGKCQGQVCAGRVSLVPISSISSKKASAPLCFSDAKKTPPFGCGFKKGLKLLRGTPKSPGRKSRVTSMDPVDVTPTPQGFQSHKTLSELKRDPPSPFSSPQRDPAMQKCHQLRATQAWCLSRGNGNSAPGQDTKQTLPAA